MKVSAVVVTYNRLPLLKECLSCLLNQTYRLNNIIVINNNSSDGTASYLNNLKNNKFIIINTSKNLGGAGGFSLGTNIACEFTNSQYIWVMDDDTMPTSSALFNMMKKAKLLNYDFGFLCSNVRWWKNNKPCRSNIPVPAKDWTASNINNLIKVHSCSFVSVLFSKKSVMKLGLPIAQMFIWGDDVDFTSRLSRDNSESYLVMDSIVFHKSKKNIPYNIITSPRVNFYKFGIRNGVYLERKHDDFHKLLKLLISYAYRFCRIPFCSNNKRIKRMTCIIIGIFNGLFFNPKIKFPNKLFMKNYIKDINEMKSK